MITPSEEVTPWAKYVMMGAPYVISAAVWAVAKLQIKGRSEKASQDLVDTVKDLVETVKQHSGTLNEHTFLHKQYVESNKAFMHTQDLQVQETKGIRDCLIRIAAKLEVEGPK